MAIWYDEHDAYSKRKLSNYLVAEEKLLGDCLHLFVAYEQSFQYFKEIVWLKNIWREWMITIVGFNFPFRHNFSLFNNYGNYDCG